MNSNLHLHRVALTLAWLAGLNTGPGFATEGRQAAEATLTIVGGALAADNADVWQPFIEARQGNGPVVIIPAASGSPHRSASTVRSTLEAYGVATTDIRVAPLALLDDSSTQKVDESRWAQNVSDPATVELLANASGIWFTGGDQSRTTALLLNSDGSATPALKAIHKATLRGASLGGTSAGAAIMSDPMILQGDTLTALTGSRHGEALKVGHGLGFLKAGLIDQHFGQRARLGRLAAALLLNPNATERIGYGIDENTALVAQGEEARVLGSGYVTVLDARAATSTRDRERLTIHGLELHLLAPGDHINLSTLVITPARWRKPTLGAEYYDGALQQGAGMALAGQTLQDVIGIGLIDDKATNVIERVSFDADGLGVRYRFQQTNRSQGFWGRSDDGPAHYTVSEISFAVEPVNVTLTSAVHKPSEATQQRPSLTR